MLQCVAVCFLGDVIGRHPKREMALIGFEFCAGNLSRNDFMVCTELCVSRIVVSVSVSVSMSVSVSVSVCGNVPLMARKLNLGCVRSCVYECVCACICLWTFAYASRAQGSRTCVVSVCVLHACIVRVYVRVEIRVCVHGACPPRLSSHVSHPLATSHF